MLTTRGNKVAPAEEYYADSLLMPPKITVEMIFSYSLMTILALFFISFLAIYFFTLIGALKLQNRSKNFMSVRLLTASTIYWLFYLLIFGFLISKFNDFGDQYIDILLFISLTFSSLMGYGYFILEKMEKISILGFLNSNESCKKFSKIIFIGLTGLLAPLIIFLSPHIFNIIVALINFYVCCAYILILKEAAISRPVS